jgi:cell division protein FtsL
MAAAAQPVMSRRRMPCWIGTPEIYFAKAIDNSRLVKVEDPRRAREMRQFGIALSCLFLLVMTYAWQHFKAIEYGYKIESLKIERDGMVEMNHALRLEDASLRDPGRIDAMARKMGLQSPQAGQVLRLEGSADAGAPVMASVQPVSMIAIRGVSMPWRAKWVCSRRKPARCCASKAPPTRERLSWPACNRFR